MRKIALALLLFSFINVTAQKDKEGLKKIDSFNQQVIKEERSLDSFSANVNAAMDAIRKKEDSIAMTKFQEQNDHNLDLFMQEIQERQHKEKIKMWTYIGLGTIFLVVGVIGITRKKNTK